MDFLPPSFLIASPGIENESFQQSVILLLEHDRYGATGLVVNRPTHFSLQEFLDIEDVEIPPQITAWSGGDCEQTKGIILHNQPANDPHASDVFGLSASNATLTRLIDAHRQASKRTAIKHPYRFLIGCVCWQAEELDKEILRGAWMQAPLDPQTLFNASADTMWQRSLAILGITPASIMPPRQPEYSH
ncbi:MAG: YqgE/AlgH family protein [Pseudomonadota bacterium]|nr:YqgE/AlgH family protein [Pseudomonadota bacterium]